MLSVIHKIAFEPQRHRCAPEFKKTLNFTLCYFILYNTACQIQMALLIALHEVAGIKVNSSARCVTACMCKIFVGYKIKNRYGELPWNVCVRITRPTRVLGQHRKMWKRTWNQSLRLCSFIALSVLYPQKYLAKQNHINTLLYTHEPFLSQIS